VPSRFRLGPCSTSRVAICVVLVMNEQSSEPGDYAAKTL
jgi:hypothetical protein